MPQNKRTSRTRSTQRPSRTSAPSQTPAPRPRTHAFTGCLTCRERHVKCDLGQPACRNCTRLDISCEGYSRKYSWIPAKFPEWPRRSSDPESLESLDGGDGQSSRRVLFSGRCSQNLSLAEGSYDEADEDRATMAVQMRDECCANSATLDLDEVLRNLQNRIADAADFTRIGPFGWRTNSKPRQQTLIRY
jgi:arginine metabolism regulation protein II